MMVRCSFFLLPPLVVTAISETTTCPRCRGEPFKTSTRHSRKYGRCLHFQFAVYPVLFSPLFTTSCQKSSFTCKLKNKKTVVPEFVVTHSATQGSPLMSQRTFYFEMRISSSFSFLLSLVPHLPQAHSVREPAGLCLRELVDKNEDPGRRRQSRLDVQRRQGRVAGLHHAHATGLR